MAYCDFDRDDYLYRLGTVNAFGSFTFITATYLVFLQKKRRFDKNWQHRTP